MAEFVLTRDRDACHAIRGFCYQVDITILRWLQLTELQSLDLEAGEDVDLVTHALTNQGPELERRLEQVKSLSTHVTLRSESVLSAIANAADHFVSNPTSALSFCFLTNADVGLERPPLTEDSIEGIRLWERLQTLPDTSDWAALANGIAITIAACQCPSGLQLVVWQRLCKFLSQATPEILRTFMRSFHWSTGFPASAEVGERIESDLISRGVGKAADVRATLFMYVFRRLSQRGRKRLTRDELLPLLARPAERYDLSFVSGIYSTIAQLEGAIGQLTRRVDAHEVSLEAVLQALSGAPALGHQIAARSSANTLPPRLSNACPRPDSVNFVLRNLENTPCVVLTGLMGAGKTQLARATFDTFKTGGIWFSARDLDDRTIAIVLKEIEAASRTSSTTIVVLDDIQLGSLPSQLCETVVYFVQDFAERRIPVLVTSSTKPTAAIAECLSNAIESISTPPFSDHEALELLSSCGGGAASSLAPWVPSINIIAEGHPILLLAFARLLSERSWEMNTALLSSFQELFGSSNAGDDLFRRLISTVQQEQARSLLFRLSLAISPFPEGAAYDVAQLAPEVTRYRESLSALLGLWVQRNAQGWLEVSPLVRPFGSRQLATDERRGVWLAFAREIVRRKSIGFTDISAALSYFSRASEFDELSLFLGFVLRALRGSDRQTALSILGIASLYGEQTSNASPRLRLFLAMNEVPLRTQFRLPTQESIGSLHSLAESVSNDLPLECYGVLIVTLDAVRNASFTNGLQHLELLSELDERVRSDSRLSNPSPSLSQFFWMVAFGVRDLEDSQQLLKFLESQPSARARAILDDQESEAGNLTLAVLGRAWLTEEKLPKEERRWAPVLEFYRHAERFGRKNNLDLFWASAVRAQVIIHGEYQDLELESLEKFVTRALDGPDVTKRSRYLLSEILGRQFAFRNEWKQAEYWLQLAANIEINGFAAIKWKSLLVLSRAIGDSRPALAAAISMQAVKCARENPSEVPENEFDVAATEAAIAFHLANDRVTAFSLLNDAAKHFVRRTNWSDAEKQTFVLFAHIVGYLTQLALKGTAPEQISTGEKYTPPWRGVMYSENALRARLFDENNYAHFGLIMLSPVMSSYAEAIGDDEAAAEWALVGIDSARRSKRPEPIAMLGQRAIAMYLMRREFSLAMYVANEAAASTIAGAIRQKSGAEFLSPMDDISAVLGPRSDPRWREVDEFAVELGGFPAMLSIAMSAISNRPAALENALLLCEAVRESREALAAPGIWNHVIDCIRSTFIDPSVERLEGIARLTAGSSAIHILALFGISVQPSCDLHRVAIIHVLIAQRMERLSTVAMGICRRIVVPFFEVFWSERLLQERFRFVAPSLVDKAFREALSVQVEVRPRRIMREIVRGLRLRMPESLAPLHEWIERDV